MGKVNAFGWLSYSGCAWHKDPKLDAGGALADLLVFSLNLAVLNILDKIESQDSSWQVTCTSRMANCLSGFTAVFRKAILCCNASDLRRWIYSVIFKDLWHADKKQSVLIPAVL
jgi:hypothetical protein